MLDIAILAVREFGVFSFGYVLAWGILHFTKIKKLTHEIELMDKDGILKLAQLAKDIEQRENEWNTRQKEAKAALANLRDGLAAKLDDVKLRELRDKACHSTLCDILLSFSQYLRFKMLEFGTNNARKEDFVTRTVIPEIRNWGKWLSVLNDREFLTDGISQPFVPKMEDYAELISLATDVKSIALQSSVRSAIGEYVKYE